MGQLERGTTSDLVRVRVGRKRRKSRRRADGRVARWVLLGLAGVLLVLFLDASYTWFTLSRDLRSIREALQRGTEQIAAGDLAGAASSFAVAQTSADRAGQATHHPATWLLGKVPGLGEDLQAVRSLATASDYTAQAGQSLALAARGAGWKTTQLPGVKPGGAIDVEVIRRAAPTVERAAVLLRRADGVLRPVTTDGLIGPVASAVETAKALLGDRALLAERAALVSRFLPGFLGADGPQRYVLLMMNLSDPRGAGGYPGTYGLLTIDRGRIHLQNLAPTSTLGHVTPITPPSKDYGRRYGPFGGLTAFISTTYSPDFPTAAQVFMRMWNASGREPIDGVIGGDSVLLSDLISAIGPVETPAWPRTITAGNVSRALDAGTFRTTSQARSDRWQGAIGTALWQALLTRPLPPVALGSALSLAASEQHLQMYAADPTQERLLGELGISGAVNLGPDPLFVSWSGLVASRAGYFARKSIAYQATAQPDGSTRVTMALTLANAAPTTTRRESILLGFKGDGYPIGAYSGLASIYLPEGATRVSSSGSAQVSLTQHEFNHRVLVRVLTAKAGESATTTISYTLAAGVLESDGLTLVPQPALSPTTVTVRFGDRVAFDGPLTSRTTLRP
jgi:Protein of unknown function (DUF4012)